MLAGGMRKQVSCHQQYYREYALVCIVCCH